MTDVAGGVSIISEPVVSPATVVADDARQFATLTFVRGGLIALGVTLFAGILAALYSVPALSPLAGWALALGMAAVAGSFASRRRA